MGCTRSGWIISCSLVSLELPCIPRRWDWAAFHRQQIPRSVLHSAISSFVPSSLSLDLFRSLDLSCSLLLDLLLPSFRLFSALDTSCRPTTDQRRDTSTSDRRQVEALRTTGAGRRAQLQGCAERQRGATPTASTEGDAWRHIGATRPTGARWTGRKRGTRVSGGAGCLAGHAVGQIVALCAREEQPEGFIGDVTDFCASPERCRSGSFCRRRRASCA